MNLALSRILSSLLLAFVLWSLLRRSAGATPYSQRLSTRFLVVCLVVAVAVLLAIPILWLAGWVINGDDGSLGITWLALGITAVLAALVARRLRVEHRRRLVLLIILFFTGAAFGFGNAEASLRPSGNYSAWRGYSDLPWRATLTAAENSAEGDLHVVVFREAAWLPGLQRRVFDHWFSVRMGPTRDLRIETSRAASERTATVFFNDEVLATVPVNGT